MGGTRRFWKDPKESDEEFTKRKKDVDSQFQHHSVILRSSPFDYTDKITVVVDHKGRSYPDKPWRRAEKGDFRTYMCFEVIPGQLGPKEDEEAEQ